MPSMAADWFVGCGVGAQQNNYEKSSTINMDGKITSDSTSSTEDNEFYMVRASVYLDDDNRLYGTYSYNADNSVS
ncbi:conserved protein of unknown function [Shewanella benthica]|uniref:Uncharacterized protein n=2 Tax=Shewanella benthica TaxID=43661 RepID=A0A330LVB6_9GAMM|nr:conserved protein of unknown function [Shewanella benthica]